MKIDIMLQTAITLAVISIMFDYCSNPSSASSTTEKATIRIDTVSYKDVKTPDNLSLYLNVETKWCQALDTARADSLTNWFALSRFKIKNMCFPVVETLRIYSAADLEHRAAKNDYTKYLES